MAPRTTYANLTDGLQPFSLFDQSFADVGNLGVIPCTAVGTNAIVLTPIAAAYAPSITTPQQLQSFSFVAAGNSTGSITIQVGTTAALKLYKEDGVTQAASGDLVSGVLYGIFYNSALNGAAGGFQIAFPVTSVINPVISGATISGSTITTSTYNGNTLTAGTGTLTLSTFTLTAANTGTVITSGSTVGGDLTGTYPAPTIAANAVSNAKFRQGAALSVVGVTGNATANVADIAGTTNQVLTVNSGGTALTFGAVNLASSAAITGNLPVTYLNSGTSAGATTFWRGDTTWSTALTSVTPGNGLTSTLTATAPGSALTTTGTLSAAHLVNAQVGTSYAIADGDRAKLITATNAAAQAYSIAQAGAASAFQAGWFVDIQNNSTNVAGIITVTPTTSTINGAATLKIQPGQYARIVSDGANYQVQFNAVGSQLPGTATNDAANAGNIGEYVESVVAVGSPVSLVTATAKDITTITLTAGDWDISGEVSYQSATTTSLTAAFASISATLNTIDVTAGRFSGNFFAAVVPGANNTAANVPVGPVRFSISGSTTYHLVAQATFTVAALNGYGIIRARRVR